MPLCTVQGLLLFFSLDMLYIFETPSLYHLDLNQEICSGNGNCACNKCQCDTDTDGGKKFYVQQCFPSDSVPYTLYKITMMVKSGLEKFLLKFLHAGR